MINELLNEMGEVTPNKEIYVGEVNKETGIIEGFYVEGIHGKEKIDEILANGGIPLSTELWQELLTYGQAKVDTVALSAIPVTMEEGEEFSYGMDCVGFFSKVESEVSDVAPEPTEVELLTERVNSLEDKLDKILNALESK